MTDAQFEQALAGKRKKKSGRKQTGDFANVRRAAGHTEISPLLTDIIESVPAAFLLCDRDDRTVVWNQRFAEWFLRDLEDNIAPGIAYRDLFTKIVESGVSSTFNLKPGWIEKRIAARKNPGLPFDHKLSDGRIARTFERRTSDGGIVSIHTDATALYNEKDAAADKARQLQIVLESIDQGISMYDGDLNCVVFNQAFLKIMGFPSDLSREGATYENMTRYNALKGEYGEVDIEEFVKQRVELAKKSLPHHFERPRTNGTIVEIRGNPVPSGGFVTTYTDITDRKAAEQAVQKRDAALSEQVGRFNAALENMSQGLCLFNKNGQLLVSNHRFAELYDLPERFRQSGSSFDDIVDCLIERGGYCVLGPSTNFDDRLKPIVASNPGSTVLELPNGRVISIRHQVMDNGGWVSTHEDITELQRFQARVAHMAHHDELTDLPNRTLLRERMEQAVPLLDRGNGFAVICLDLDRFKNVNDTIGHPMGDKLLQAAADRLRECVRETDTIARLGGDEFAILQVSDNQPSDSTAVAARICDVMSKPFDLGRHQVVVGASVGIALAPTDGRDPDDLLKNADMALYRAKNDGRGVFRYFETDMDARMQTRRHVEHDLRKALELGEFELHYQPLVNLESNIVTGFEALLRWHHSERGQVSPGEFVQVAEDIGMIVPLGEWVVRQACMDAASWPADIKVAVNLSPAQFRDENLANKVFSALADSKIAAGRLELEITEQALLQQNEMTLKTLHTLRNMGVKIAMDDFGTGYSSLSYLRSFPFDKIKIDRSFVQDLSERADADAIVKAVASLSKNLGMATTAEGVETEFQRQLVKDAGYTEMQGFLFSPAVPSSDIAETFFKEQQPVRKAG